MMGLHEVHRHHGDWRAFTWAKSPRGRLGVHHILVAERVGRHTIVRAICRRTTSLDLANTTTDAREVEACYLCIGHAKLDPSTQPREGRC